MTNSSPSSKAILITGASSGIGRATATVLAEAGHHVFLGARRADRIAEHAAALRAKGAAADHQVLDVTDLESVRSFVAFAVEKAGTVDVLVNNAGVMPLSRLDELEIDDWNQMIDVNIRGVLNGIAAVLPIMRDQGSGHVINVASTAAHRVTPSAVVYCATKFAVWAISEGLRQESRDIRSTVVCPGHTRTELFDAVRDPKMKEMFKRNSESGAVDSEDIAKAIAYAVAQPDDVDVAELIVRSVRAS